MRHATLLLLLAVSFLVPPDVAAAGDEVILVNIEGVVSRGTLIHVTDALEEAESRGVPLLLQLDTPGGLVDATLDIYKAVERAEVPVLSFVGPRGGFAASAGTLILLMGHPSGMAPGTQIGSAQPIQVDPSGGTQNASSKTTNFLVERIRVMAERTDRDPDIAEQFITENRNMDEGEALELEMIDVIATDAAAFLDAVHGRQAIVGDSTVVLDTEDARIVVYERSLLAKTVDLIGNPQLSFVFFLVGMYALIFGLANPGTYVPETIGALLLLLGLIGFGLFNASTAGVLLMLLAAAFFVAEVFTPTHGVLTVVGVVALVFAVIFLVREPLLPSGVLRQFYIVGMTAAALSGAAVLGAVWIAARTQNRPVEQEGVGKVCLAASPIDPIGQVEMEGEIWGARTRGEHYPEGAVLHVVARDGLKLVVEGEGSTDEEE